MKPPELLTILLKAMGAWTLIRGMAALPGAVRFSHDYPDEQALLMMVADTFAAPIFLIAVGWLMIRRTNRFVDIAYRGSNPPAESTDDRQSREWFGVILKAMGYADIIGGLMRVPYEIARLSRAIEKAYDGIAN